MLERGCTQTELAPRLLHRFGRALAQKQTQTYVSFEWWRLRGPFPTPAKTGADLLGGLLVEPTITYGSYRILADTLVLAGIRSPLRGLLVNLHGK